MLRLPLGCPGYPGRWLLEQVAIHEASKARIGHDVDICTKTHLVVDRDALVFAVQNDGLFTGNVFSKDRFLIRNPHLSMPQSR